MTAEMGSLRSNGIRIQTVSVSVRSNRVVLGVVGLTSALEDMLVKRFGEMATVEATSPAVPDACNSRTDCAPPKGGIKIYRTGFASTTYCTIGLIGKPALSSGPMQIITAGHCLETALEKDPTGTFTYSHHGSVIGVPTVETWAPNAVADAGLITISAGVFATGDPRNKMYYQSAGNLINMLTYKTTSDQDEGSLVCRAGIATGYLCGEVINTDDPLLVDGKTVLHQWRVDFDASPGDSGAPYLLGSTAWGIHTDSTDNDAGGTHTAWYSPMGWIFTALSNAGHPTAMCGTSTCN